MGFSSGAADQATAEAVAREAGELLLTLRESADARLAPDRLRADGDRLSHELIMRLLAERCPLDAVLSEEGTDDAARLDAERVWIVDPLDGTREYGEYDECGEHKHEHGWRTDWAVHIALWSRGRGLTAGAVAIPGRGEVFGTRASTASLPSSRTWGAQPLRVAASRSHPAAIVDELAAVVDVELHRMGSAGVKAMAVVTGEVDAYVHSGGQYEWDSAAPVAVALAAGCAAHRLDGSPLEYNRANPWLPDLVIAAPGVAAELARVVATLPSVERRTVS
ncbi:3'(2'),5'-bisphosphate nucleotidase CysQ [Microbacterium sp. STN6]|uniref:3'(2'),5'-bisphosphate nucleotidase CysQ n=1 Tax=Microbacterium sp. STN6 TaxID=2995588 RepID=UPI002260C7C4|nr:3'(2'),5'-bisphosphate nucleotidase CysQ [Microbacterium sp. STN6]MCX7521606.1 3'(2'),5'-bisphosphate nucleotidase CysQ [Microbacterium sp. STN6]